MPVATARSRTVYARQNFGLFAARCDAAAVATAEEIAKEGAKVSRQLAPSGKKADSRPGHTKLKRSIKHKANGTRAEWYSTSKHALPIELGAARHFIIGKGIKFRWAGAADPSGWFWWNNPAFRNYNWDEENGVVIDHPGNKAQPFLYPAYEQVAKGHGAMRIAKRVYRRHGLV